MSGARTRPTAPPSRSRARSTYGRPGSQPSRPPARPRPWPPATSSRNPDSTGLTRGGVGVTFVLALRGGRGRGRTSAGPGHVHLPGAGRHGPRARPPGVGAVRPPLVGRLRHRPPRRRPGHRGERGRAGRPRGSAAAAPGRARPRRRRALLGAPGRVPAGDGAAPSPWWTFVGRRPVVPPDPAQPAAGLRETAGAPRTRAGPE